MKTKKLAFLFFYFLIFQAFSGFSQEKDSLNYYVYYYDNAKNPDQLLEALTYFKNEKERSLSNKWYVRAAYCLYYIADADLRFESLYESEKIAVDALMILDSIKEIGYSIDYKLSLYNHLGILKRRQNDYESSIKYYNKSLTFSPTKKDSALAFNNIGVALLYMKEYKKAKSRLLFAVNTFRVLNDSIHIALALDNLGKVKGKLNEEDALSDLMEAFAIRKEVSDNAIYESYNNIVDYYKDRNELKLALQYAKEGYREAKNSTDLSYQLQAVRSLIGFGLNEYAEELIQIDDQIDSIQKQNDIKYAAVKFNFANELEKRKKAELETELTKRERTTYQLIGFSIFIIGLVLILYINGRNTKNAVKKEFDTEQRISRRLHDEVANEVFHMMTTIQREEVHEIELLDTLEEVYEKVRDIAKANSEVNVSQDYGILIDDLIMKYISADINIIKDSIFDIPWEDVSRDKKRVLYRVIQELMTNMKKHSNADLVTFSFEKKRSKLEVKYADNGVGCDLEKGNGLQNVESRIKMVKGQIIFDSKVNDGFYASLIL